MRKWRVRFYIFLIVGLSGTLLLYGFLRREKREKERTIINEVVNILTDVVGKKNENVASLIDRSTYQAIREYIKNHYFKTEIIDKVVVSELRTRDNDKCYLVTLFSILFPKFNFVICKDIATNKFILKPLYDIKKGDYDVLKEDNLHYYFRKSESDGNHYITWMKDVQKMFREREESCFDGLKVNSKNRKIYYIVDDSVSDKYILYPFLRTNSPVDTLSILLFLVQNNKNYLKPFINGYYIFRYTSHEFNRIDYIIWLRKLLEYGNIQDNVILNDFVLDTVINKIVAYTYIRYLHDKLNMNSREIWCKLIKLDSLETKLVKNNGDILIFFKHYITRISKRGYDNLLKGLIEYIFEYPADIIIDDTLSIKHISDLNITYYISRLYGNYVRVIQDSFNNWLSSLSLFYYPNVNVVILPAFEKERLEVQNLTKTNAIVVSEVEFSNYNGNFNGVLRKMKEDYFKIWLKDYMKTYSVSERVLPIWFSLGIPVFFAASNNKIVEPDIVADVVFLDLKDYINLIQYGKFKASLGMDYRSSKAYKSFSVLTLLKIEDLFGRGTIKKILEKGFSSIDFNEAFKSATGENVKDFMRGYLKFIRDSLYFLTIRRKMSIR